MSDEYIWDQEANNGNQTADPNPRDLRTQINALGAKLKERDDAIANLTSRIRARDVESLLSKTGLDPKVAELVPDSVEATEDGVKAWADKYGSLFAKPTEGESKPAGESNETSGNDGQTAGGTTPSLTPEQIAALSRMQSQDTAAGSTTPDIEAAQVAQLQSMLQAANGSSDVFIESLLNSGRPTT